MPPLFSIESTIKSYPSHPYQEIKDAVVGKRYSVTLTFLGPARAKALNIATRKKDYVPNVLSFPLDDTAGEVYICPATARLQAKDFNLSIEGYVAYLFIHGLLHLKGHDHGDTMDALERRFLKKFDIS